MAKNARINIFCLKSSVILAGFWILALQISCARFVSPIFGQSVITWTSLIGVSLASISVGALLGGNLIDRWYRARLVILLFFVASFFVLFGVWVLPLTKVLAAKYFGVAWGSTFLSSTLIALPIVALSSITPAAAKLLASKLGANKSGKAFGAIAMGNSLGSLLGVFVTGFYLLAHLSVYNIFFVGALSLLVWAGILTAVRMHHAGRERFSVFSFAAFVILCIFAAHLFWRHKLSQVDSGIIYRGSSFYHAIRVEERDVGEQRSARALYLDSSIEGGEIVQTGELIFDYQKYWQIANFLAVGKEDKSGTALFVGGGAFSMPKNLLMSGKNWRADAVEIDENLVKVARKFFLQNFSKSDVSHKLRIIVDDGRRFLQSAKSNGTLYDLIFIDAFSGQQGLPPHLATREFFDLARSCLRERGIFASNIISAAQGQSSKLLRTYLLTLRTSFEGVLCFTPQMLPLNDLQNIIVLAGNASTLTYMQNAARLELLSSPNLLRLRNSMRIIEQDSFAKKFLASKIDETEFLNLGNSRTFTDELTDIEGLISMQIKEYYQQTRKRDN